MAMTKKIDASSTKTMDACDNSYVSPWKDLNHDVLFLVMMKLGVIDFVVFSGVCNSWRSVALENRKKFMASKPPIYLIISRIPTDPNEKDCLCKLTDFDGRYFKTIIPQSGGREYIGSTCGYLIYFGEKIKDYWLVNPITRHQLHFPRIPVDVNLDMYSGTKGILVFSRSLSSWLFVMLEKKPWSLREDVHHRIWFCIVGKGEWNYVSSTFHRLCDIFAFKGKMYIIRLDNDIGVDVGQLCEVRFDSEPKLTLLKTKNFPKIDYRHLGFASCGEKLYIYQQQNAFVSADLYEIQVVEIGEMKYVYRGKKDGYGLEKMNRSADVGRWSKTPLRVLKRNYTHVRHFPHKCFNVNLIE